jgi:tRNA-specific 2-thiouridylase
VERHPPAGEVAGDIVSAAGEKLGRHAGVHRLTVGQRRGLGLTSVRPRYVLAIRPEAREVVVGDEEDLAASALTVREASWLGADEPEAPRRARVKIRYRHPEAEATLLPLGGGRLRVAFEEPVRAVTPGQAAVFYEGDACLGGGWIEGPEAP